jgi:hypothetical protein
VVVAGQQRDYLVGIGGVVRAEGLEFAKRRNRQLDYGCDEITNVSALLAFSRRGPVGRLSPPAARRR